MRLGSLPCVLSFRIYTQQRWLATLKKVKACTICWTILRRIKKFYIWRVKIFLLSIKSCYGIIILVILVCLISKFCFPLYFVIKIFDQFLVKNVKLPNILVLVISNNHIKVQNLFQWFTMIFGVHQEKRI